MNGCADGEGKESIKATQELAFICFGDKRENHVEKPDAFMIDEISQQLESTSEMEEGHGEHQINQEGEWYENKGEGRK